MATRGARDERAAGLSAAVDGLREEVEHGENAVVLPHAVAPHARTLTQLADAGVVRERTGMRRNRVWQHDGVLAVLDLFAQAIHRR